MIVSISIPPSSSSNPKLPPTLAKISHDEVILIELQGSLEVEENDASDRDGKFIGKLKIDASTNVPTLLIGHHLLEGKISNLPKPLAVLHRSVRRTASATNSAALENGMGVTEKDGDDGGDDNNDDVEMADLDLDSSMSQEEREIETVGWDVVAVVKRKIVFAKRPMPVVHLKNT